MPHMEETFTPRDPIITRTKSNSSQDKRRSVSDITDLFQAKIDTPVTSPSKQMPPRKISGKKDKEKEKELKEVRENIKRYINNMGSNNDTANANGDSTPSAIKATSSLEREATNTQHDHSNEHVDEQAIDGVKNASPESEKVSIATQTTEDEMLKAIKELADKYGSMDQVINDPRQGIANQLAKTQQTVANLYTDIHGAVSGVKVQLESLTKTAMDNSNKIAKMENSQARMAALLDENKRLVSELKIMQGLVHKVTLQTDTNTNSILDLTKRGMEQNLVLHGVDDTIERTDPQRDTPHFSAKERCKHAVIEFLKKEMSVDLEVADIWKAHRMGAHKPDKVRPMVVKVSYEAKDLIMEKMSSLKDKQNPTTKQKYFISEQLPEGIVEGKKQLNYRLDTLKKANEAKPKEAKDRIQVHSGKILINGELDKPEVTTPKPSDLFLDSIEQQQVEEIQDKLVETDRETHSHSEFIGLALKVHSTQEVQMAYKAVAQRYPASDHIMLGYALRQDRELKTGSCDDKEYGAGIRIRKTIFEMKAKNTAVFILRKFGGIHLGFQRFKIIEDITRKVVEQLNENVG